MWWTSAQDQSWMKTEKRGVRNRYFCNTHEKPAPKQPELSGREGVYLWFNEQVRPAGQAGYPEVTIESFVGHSSMVLLCPPAVEVYYESLFGTEFDTHTHTHQPKFYFVLFSAVYQPKFYFFFQQFKSQVITHTSQNYIFSFFSSLPAKILSYLISCLLAKTLLIQLF